MAEGSETSAGGQDFDAVTSVKLRDGRVLEVRTVECPLPQDLFGHVLEFLRAEWPEGDMRWEEAFAGAYADSLRIVVCVGARDGPPVGNVTLVIPVEDREVGVICDVLTRPDQRGLGIASALMRAAVNQFDRHGGRAIYLGTLREEQSWRVYERVGFEWFHGGVMRRVSGSPAEFDATHFAPGQSTHVRRARWGDLPGVSALFTAPYESVAGDLSRGILSARHAQQNRCVSIFPTIYYDVHARGGVCQVLVGERTHRVLGLANLTPANEACCSHVAVLELLTHDAYRQQRDALLRSTIQAGRECGFERAIVHVPVTDEPKARWLGELQARAVGVLSSYLRLPGGDVDVAVFELDLKGMSG